MGIPSYFSYIIKNHHKIIKEHYKSHIHELYFDSNSIIYDSIRNILKKDELQLQVEVKHKQLYHSICLQLEIYIKQINPTDMVYISFDGIAPFAKLKQQRDRRFKSQYTKQIFQSILQQKTTDDWDTCCLLYTSPSPRD